MCSEVLIKMAIFELYYISFGYSVMAKIQYYTQKTEKQ